ncbi:SNF2 family N-terminal domain-containing protein [Pilobolus umbonatus]|nr:SNF2 family N-terminal domain-containing protein [Pilobolus umbonatus]
MIEAGTILIQIEDLHSYPSDDWACCDWDHIQTLNLEKSKAHLIHSMKTLETLNMLSVYYQSMTHHVLFKLYVSTKSNYSKGKHTLTFLELLVHVNRNTNPLEFISVFSTHTYSSLLSIFIHLPSPEQSDVSDIHSPDVIDYLDNDIHLSIPGMKTTLYHYQRNSLWKILQRELAPMLIRPEELIQLTSVDNQHYYFNQLTGEVSTDYRPVQDIKGGIICEDMGTGKTCICLAVIMATKDFSLSLSDYVDRKTDLLRSIPAENKINSLKSIAAALVLKEGINWKPYRNRLPEDVLAWFHQYPVYYEWMDIPPHIYDRPHRVQPRIQTMHVYLSTTTLVVVPDNLIAQWTGEIYKHIKDNHLEFIVYDDIKQVILPASTLVYYDLVLMSQTRFSHENTQGGFELPKTIQCECPSVRSTGEKACVCPTLYPSHYQSPLLRVHWKRLIVDEGHRLSSMNHQSQLTIKLFANWRWICTGTPTQNLTESISVRVSEEENDLKRLGILFGNVLGLEPFKSKRALWKRLIASPFLQRKPWAIDQLAGILQRCMIRNRKEDIGREVKLPPLTHRIVYLEFDYYQWIAHNCQIAMIVLNAILSERVGPDYLFYPKNYKSLRETVHNLWQSCLWYSVDLNQLKIAYENCMEKCGCVEDGTADYGSGDNQDLFRIRDTLEHALHDSMFMDMMHQNSPSYIVQGLPTLFEEYFGRCLGKHGVYDESDHSYCILPSNVIFKTFLANTHHPYLFAYQNNQLLTYHEYEKNKKSEAEVTFFTENVFTDASIVSSTSSKINYLLNQIRQYHLTDKCIVFSQHTNEMYEIYSALRLAKIRTLLYQDSPMSNVKRSHMILTFNTSDNANVIIMDVRKAAYGIDLSSASRVYFMSPVWQTGTEQQAIKRAHRIGQTKPVHVETLVIRDTIEDRLLQRRDQVTQESVSEQDKQNSRTVDSYGERDLSSKD